MDILLVHKEILELFKKYKISWETTRLPMDNLNAWSKSVSKYLHINEITINKKLNELFWALGSVQLSLGYALISRQTCNFPKGIKGEAFQYKDVPDFIGISEIHLYHHLNNGWESLYKCWERLSILLGVIIYPNENEKLYFNDMIDKISNDQVHLGNSKIKLLKSQVKYWNKVARERNEISHFESSPMKIFSYESGIAKVYGAKNQFIPKISYSTANLINEINKIKDCYYRIFPATITIKEFIEEHIRSKNIKVKN